MGALHQLRQPRVSLDQIVSIAFRMRGGKTNALEFFNLMNGLEQLHKWCLAIFYSNFSLAIAGDDLAKQGDFLNSARDQLARFGHDFSNRAAPLCSSGIRDNAKSAVLIAALHDADKSSYGLFSIAVEEVLLDSRLAARFLCNIDDFGAPAIENIIQVICRPVKLLSANHQVHVGEAIDQFLSPALGHAPKEPEHHSRAAAAQLGG